MAAFSPGCLGVPNSQAAAGAKCTFSSTTLELDVTTDTINGVECLQIPIPLPAQYRCLACDYTTNVHRQLKNHWKVRCVKREISLRFSCQICGEHFQDVKSAKLHYKCHESLDLTYQRKMLAVVNSFKMQEDDTICLRPSEWLTDRVIDFALTQECLKRLSTSAYYAISSLFTETLDHFAQGVRNATARQLLLPWAFEAEGLFLPLNHANRHWSLLDVDFTSGRVYHLDSMPAESHRKRAESIIKVFGEYVQYHFDDQRFCNLDVVHEKSPKQRDGCNCGVFVVQNAVNRLDKTYARGMTAADCSRWRETTLRTLGVMNKDSLTLGESLDDSITPLTTKSTNRVAVHPTKNCSPLQAVPSLEKVDQDGSSVPFSTPETKPTILDWSTFVKSLPLGRIMERIPKGSRTQAAQVLTDALNMVINFESEDSWVLLFSFPSFCLSRPRRAIKTHNLTTYVKEQLAKFSTGNLYSAPGNPKRTLRLKPLNIEVAVTKKLSEFDIKGAVRLVSGGDSLAPRTSDTLVSLIEKHPRASESTSFPNAAAFPVPPTVVRKDILAALKSFPNGSSGGWEGLRPGHLRDLTANWLGVTGERLLDALTRFTNKVLSGNVLPEVRPAFYGARLIALSKKSGGIRPIAVGLTLRRLAGKVSATAAVPTVSSMLQPQQLGVGVRGGAEAAIHGFRTLLNHTNLEERVILKIDFKNAFNSIRRDHMLQTIAEHLPENMPFLHSCYEQPSLLVWGDEILSSEEGAQQGDPWGPIAFSLAIDSLVKSLKSSVSSWYLDDGTLMGTLEEVNNDLKTIIQEGEKIGLEVNPSKCEFVTLGAEEQFHKQAKSVLEQTAPGIRRTPVEQLELLGAPLHVDGTPSFLRKARDTLAEFSVNLSKLQAHDALFLLQHCFSIPKITYLLRTTLCHGSPILAEYDGILRGMVEDILNCNLTNATWKRASLPIANGGLGLRCSVDVALPAYLASIHSAGTLATKIALGKESRDFSKCLALWDVSYSKRPSAKSLGSQGAWSEKLYESRVTIVWSSLKTDFEKAGFKAAESPGSGAWLSAVPVGQLGLRMNNEEIRIATGLRLGLDVVAPHTCICGSNADQKGIHGLNCAKVPGRGARHTELNHLIHRALNSAQYRSVLEPEGLCKDQNIRPDGMTLIPWDRGRCLAWDVSCVNTVAQSNIQSALVTAGGAAARADRRKKVKYKDLDDQYQVVPIVVETLGVLGPSARSFLKSLGHRLALRNGETRSTEFLTQRISVAIQRGNAMCILGTMVKSQDDEDDSLDVALADLR